MKFKLETNALSQSNLTWLSSNFREHRTSVRAWRELVVVADEQHHLDHVRHLHHIYCDVDILLSSS